MDKRVTKRIVKKVFPKHFEDIVLGKKTFDLRLADFYCEEGDELILKEWNPVTEHFTGRQIMKTIGYVLRTDSVKFWTKEDVDKYGLQVIGFSDETKKDK